MTGSYRGKRRAGEGLEEYQSRMSRPSPTRRRGIGGDRNTRAEHPNLEQEESGGNEGCNLSLFSLLPFVQENMSTGCASFDRLRCREL
jgi:hypothetical protein